MIRGIYPIIDPSFRPDLSESYLIEKIVRARPPQVQIRVKNRSDREFLSLAKLARKITSQNGVIMIVNDRVDIAILSDADGVHLGQDDLDPKAARLLLGKNKIVGISTHSWREASGADPRLIDYLAFGPIFSSSTKPDSAHKAKGISELRAIVKKVRLPVVAIGGINEDNLSEVIDTGVAGVAMISAILNASDISGTIEKFQRMFSQQKVNQEGEHEL